MRMAVWAGVFFGSLAHGAEDPDELYRKGRFTEAQKIYSQADMDHPRDLRYRYNRGCAEYQAGDYKGAMAAFSSVLRRGEEREIRFRAAYNLGNAAFKEGDAASAAEYYRQAIRIDPNQENAQHNLELALRELKSQEKEKEEKEKSSGKEGGQQDPSKTEGEKEKPLERPSPDASPDKDGDQERDTDGKDAGTPPEEKRGEDEGEKSGQDQDERPDRESPKDLSKELKPREALPEPSQEPEGGPPAASSMDSKKAEALLDNVTEDRSRFLQLQMPEERRRGAVSGKDW
ncbi:MAG: tetratricopeptide repeat protein [Deltaproteobacteria bacterium]|nr:tetratricopeptide repeat protein [Deltaproteobacteria bacterium]